MHRLAELSLRNRALIALVTLAIAFFGVLSMTSLKQELIPSISLPRVTVITTYPGASPEIVEADVTGRVESALQGLQGLESTSTVSSANRSVVSVDFVYGTDIVYAEQRVQQALNRIDAQLPDDAESSVLSGGIDDLPIVQIAVTGGDPIDVAERIRTQVLGELRSLPGVRGAELFGDLAERIAITPRGDDLAARGLDLQSISDTLENAGVLIPAGQLTEGDSTLTVQAGTVLAGAADLADLPIVGAEPDPDGGVVTIGTVADVVLDREPATSIARVDGEDALTISITKRPAANTVEVSQEVARALPQLGAGLGDGVELRVVMDQAPFITDSIDTLVTEGLLGLVFAVLVILVFLLSVRATIITAVSIPTSLLATFIALQFADYTLNILTLGALTIAIGRVVDDSIVVIENIRRHLDLHPTALRRPAERVRVIAGAVREVAGAITASTITTVAVFLPMAFVDGMVGELFRPFAFTVTIALIASLLVSLTIVPVLAHWFLGGARLRRRGRGRDAVGRAADDELAQAPARADLEPAEAPAHALPIGADTASRPDEAPAPAGRRALPIVDGRPVDPDTGAPLEPLADADALAAKARRAIADDEPRNWLQRGYEPVLRFAIARPLVVLLLAVLVLVGTGALAPLMKTNFLGSSGQGMFSIRQIVPQNASLATLERYAERVEAELDAVDGIGTVQLTYGSNPFATAFGGTSNAINWSVTTADGADADAVEAAARERLLAAAERGDEIGHVTVGFGGGFSDSVTVRVHAPDLPALAAAVDAVVSELREVRAVQQVTSGLDETRPFVRLDIDQVRAAELGLSEFAVGAQVAQALQPVPAGSVMIDGASLRLYYLGDQTPPDSVDALRELRIGVGPAAVPLREVADVEVVDGPVSITAASGTPYTDLEIETSQDDLGGLSAELEQAIERADLADGARAELAGTAADQRQAFAQLGLALLAAILIVYVVMVATFRSLLQPLLLLVSVPFAATGALLLLVATGIPLGIASLIGVLMLVGIVVTNAIVLIDLVNQYRRRGLRVREATFEGSTRRVRPIVMTALATILALTPMGIGITGKGGFISQPLAVVVIGGLLSSTFLTLLVLPSLYVLVEGRLERGRERRAELAEQQLRDAGLA